MKYCIRFLENEIEIAKKIQQDEIWLEGERQHHKINSEDPNVLKTIDQIIIGHLDEIEHEAKYKICNNCGKCLKD